MVFLVESKHNGKSADIVVYSRDDKGKKITDVISNFFPYFYVDEDEIVPDDSRIKSITSGYVEILGNKVKKITYHNTMDSKDLREKFKKSYEADIVLSHRYLIDVVGEIKPYPLKTLCIDIELDTDDAFPDMENPNMSITSICMLDSMENKKTKIILKYPMWTPETVEELTKNNVIICKTEEQVLGTFLSKFIEYDADVITGWNVSNFDLIYIIKRMEQLGIDINALSPMHHVYQDRKTQEPHIRGRIIMDMMKSYRHFRKISNQGELESYSLEFVSQEVLSMGKIQHEQTYGEMWRLTPVAHINYNMRDVELVLQINEKLKILDFFNQIRCISCAPLAKIFQTTILLDGYLLRRLHNLTVLPSKAFNEESDYEGADVVKPVPGIYKNAFAFDVGGMYPNIIRTFNMGYETYNPSGEIKISDQHGFNKGTGILASAIIDLGKERKKNKKLRDTAITDEDRKLYEFRQYAIKVLMNSLYGYMGFVGSRLYKKEVAESITLIGRELINWAITLIRNKDYIVLYSDTDSTYVKAKSETLIDLLIEGNKLMKEINTSFNEFSKAKGADECTIYMEFEKIFKKIFFVSKKGDEENGAKKKYAYILMWKDKAKVDNKIKLVGFGAKRSDNTKISRTIQRKVVEMIMNEESKESIIAYLKDVHKQIITKQISDEDIGFPKQIKKELTDYGKLDGDGQDAKTIGIPPVVNGCLYSNKYLGTRFGIGHKPKWIYVKSVPKGYPDTHVIAYLNTVPAGFGINYPVMISKIFKDNLEQIFLSAKLGEFPNIDSTIKTLDFG
jgi:DNA polymerase I